MLRKPPPLKPEQAQAAVEALFRHYFRAVTTNRILAEAQRLKDEVQRLRDEAQKFGCLGEVDAIMRPQTRRGRGRQKGWHSPKLAERRRKLWKAYCEQKAKTPGDSIAKIAKRMDGHSPKATAALLTKMEANSHFWPIIFRSAGIKLKAGRPKKWTANPYKK